MTIDKKYEIVDGLHSLLKHDGLSREECKTIILAMNAINRYEKPNNEPPAAGKFRELLCYILDEYSTKADRMKEKISDVIKSDENEWTSKNWYEVAFLVSKLALADVINSLTKGEEK